MAGLAQLDDSAVRVVGFEEVREPRVFLALAGASIITAPIHTQTTHTHTR